MDDAPDIVAVGNLVWETTVLLDRLPGEAELDRLGVDALVARAVEVVRDGGGSSANTLVAAAAMGLRVAFVGRGGDDDAGRLAAASLAAAGVDARVRLLPGRRTKQNFVLKEAGTDRGAFRAVIPPRVAPPLRADEVPGSLLAGAGILHLDRVSATGADLARRRAALGRPVTLDLHDAPLRPEARERLSRLWSCLAGVQLSEGAARSLAAIVAGAPGRGVPDFARGLSRRVPRVVVTRGAAGAFACEGGTEVVAIPPVAPARLIDSTGAGDAFAAAFLGACLRGACLIEAARAGAVAGSRACESLGARGAWRRL